MKKSFLTLLVVSTIFAQEEIKNPIEVQLQNVNFQAGKKVISTAPAKFETKAKISPKEFEKTKYKEILKPYIPKLTSMSSEEIDRLLRENLKLIAYYKANKVYLTLLAYQTGKDLQDYIDKINSERGNKPSFGKVLKVAWYKPKTKEVRTETKPQGKTAKEVKEKELQVEGYCVFPNKVEVYTKPFNVKTICYFNNLSEGYLYGKLVPDLSQKMLKFQPILFEDTEGKKYLVKPILVLNAEKSSPNLATYINERELEKVLAKATKSSMQDTKEMLKEYFKNQGTSVEVNGDVVIENKEYSLANIGEFALKDFLASLVEAGAEVINSKLENIPTIFEVEKGTAFYVELLLIPLKT